MKIFWVAGGVFFFVGGPGRWDIWCNLVQGWTAGFLIHSRHSNHPFSDVAASWRYVLLIPPILICFKRRFLHRISGKCLPKMSIDFLNSTFFVVRRRIRAYYMTRNFFFSNITISGRRELTQTHMKIVSSSLQCPYHWYGFFSVCFLLRSLLCACPFFLPVNCSECSDPNRVMCFFFCTGAASVWTNGTRFFFNGARSATT